MNLPITSEALPKTLPVFPLPGVVLLPRARLPLNIYEPRYIAMIDDALKENRLIGMIQPQDMLGANSAPLYSVGCAGRIVSFSETDDNRYLLALAGVVRFSVEDEIPTTRGYRRIVANWDRFRQDTDKAEEQVAQLDRSKFGNTLKAYFRLHNIEANWQTISDMSDEKFLNALTMMCPFEVAEKQALLEAPTLNDRAALLESLIAMGVAEASAPIDVLKH